MPNILIAPFQTGLEKDKESWLLPQDAFITLEDVYVWRGKLRKKQGYTLLGRLHNDVTLPEALGNTAGAGTTFNAVLASQPVSPGTLTVTAGALSFQDNGNGTLSETTGAATYNYGTIDYESGTIDLYMNPGVGVVAVAATAYRILPRLSCMGLGLYENTLVNEENLIAFDEDYSYLYNTATSVFDELDDAAGNVQTWNGDNYDFFWTCNYYYDTSANYLFWATNNVANSVVGGQTQDGIQIFNGTAWYAQTPVIDAVATELRGCLILLPYKDRMVALNTLEGAAATRYPNRARWSQNGVPYTTTLGGADATAWRHDQIGKGGYIDAPTRQAIVSAAFIKDALVVFFERSTWQLRYTGNELLPFIWEQVNSELGAESAFSPVGFDKGIFAVGDKGIISTSGIDVERIDQKIPDEVFNFHNDNTGPARVHGIRDFYNEMVYWTFPNDDPDDTFPDKVLALNYIDGSYSIFNDSFTCFGRYQERSDYTWDTLPFATWDDWNIPWGSPISQSYFPSLIAGNQKGLVLKLNQGVENDVSLDLTTSIGIPDSIDNTSPALCQCANHNIKTGQFVKLQDVRGFGITVTNEDIGMAELGVTGYNTTLANLGVIPAVLTITDGTTTIQDLGDGTFSTGGIFSSASIDYESGAISITFTAALAADTNLTATYDYNVLNQRVFYVQDESTDTFTIYTISETTGATVPVDLTAYASYTGSGKVAIMNNFKVKTKEFTPLVEQGYEFRLANVDLFLGTSSGSFTINSYTDQSGDITVSLPFSSVDDTGRLSDKHWSKCYPNVISDFIQLELGLNNYQMTEKTNYTSDWTLHAMNLEIQPAGKINR